MSNVIPNHVREKLSEDRDYYSLTMDNIERCKVDAEYLGDVMLVNENLIWHSVHKYVGNPMVIVKTNCIEKDDILQLGRLGFIKAIHAFDTTRGFEFSSFAVTAIVREIRCFLRDSGSIMRPTRTARDLINRINRIENEFGYLPSVEDLSILLDVKEDKIKKALQVGRPVKYLHERISNAGKDGGWGYETTLLDFIEDTSEKLEDKVIDQLYIDSVVNALGHYLSDLELQVLKLRLSGLSQTQTAKKKNISQMRVSRIMKKIANIIRNTPELSDLINTA